MGLKKKRTSNKLACMTEDEKMKYLQYRAAMEEEAQHRKQELIIMFLRKKLKHEEIFSYLNSTKINQQWRIVLRQTNYRELDNNIKNLRRKFAIGLDYKDKLIQSLLLNLKHTEFQNKLQYEAKAEILKTFLAFYENKHAHLQEWHIQQINHILTCNRIIKKKILLENGERYTLLKKFLRGYAKQSENGYIVLRAKADQQISHLSSLLLHSLMELKIKFALELCKLKKSYKGILQQFKDEANIRKAHYTVLESKDRCHISRIESNIVKITSYLRRIKNVRHVQRIFELTKQRRQEEVNTLYNEIRNTFLALRIDGESALNIGRSAYEFHTIIGNREFKAIEERSARRIRLLVSADCKRLLIE